MALNPVVVMLSHHRQCIFRDRNTGGRLNKLIAVFPGRNRDGLVDAG